MEQDEKNVHHDLFTRPLVDGERLVHVDYSMPRGGGACASSTEMLSKHAPAPMFKGNDKWQTHLSCAGIDQAPGERIMLAKEFRRGKEIWMIIPEMNERGYRPAIHLEAYAYLRTPFIQAERMTKDEFCIALGSYAVVDGVRRGAVLYRDSERFFIDGNFSPTWFFHTGLCLFVRKSA